MPEVLAGDEDSGESREPNMSAWLCIPSARPVAEANACIDRWHAMGYLVAMVRDWVDTDHDTGACLHSDYTIFSKPQWGGYPGYAQSVNLLARHVLTMDPGCDWIVCAGDDTEPDPSKRADEIAAECSEYFGTLWNDRMHERYHINRQDARTFGVMQPTGDPWSDHMGRIIERIAGSPWLGRAWCLRANQGKGPLWPDYTHCFGDEELWNVAQMLGVYWQRTDLIHLHNNWARPRGDVKDKPEFLAEATSPEHWRKFSALFRERKAAGFPGHEPQAFNTALPVIA